MFGSGAGRNAHTHPDKQRHYHTHAGGVDDDDLGNSPVILRKSRRVRWFVPECLSIHWSMVLNTAELPVFPTLYRDW